MTSYLREDSTERRETVRCILTCSMKNFDRHCQFVGIYSVLFDSYIINMGLFLVHHIPCSTTHDSFHTHSAAMIQQSSWQ